MAKLRMRLSIILLLLVLPNLLVSDAKTPFRIGIVALSPNIEQVQSLVHEVLASYQNAFVVDEQQIATFIQKKEEEQQKAWEVALQRAYQDSDDNRIALLKAQSKPFIEVPTDFSVSYEQVSYDKNLYLAFNEHIEAMDWFLSKKGYDALILLEAMELDSFVRIRISNYEKHFKEPKLLFDRLVQHAFFQSLKPELQKIFFTYSSKGSWAALDIERNVAGLQVYIDNKKQSLFDPYLIIKPGKYSLSLRAPNFSRQDTDIFLEGNEILLIRPQLTRLEQKNLELYSNQGVVNWSKEGKLLDQSLSITLANPSYPLVLTVSKEGFQSQIIHVSAPMPASMAITLQPQKLASEDLLLSVQKDFYKRLRNTILLFGAYVGCTALSKTYDVSNPLWQLGMVATSSLALVSSTAMVLELASYATLATEGASY